MIERLPRSKRNLALLALALLFAWGAWEVRAILNPLLAAYVLAFIAHPLVLRLEARGWSRMRAVNVIYAVFILATLLVSWGVWAQGQRLVGRVLNQDTGLLDNLDESFGVFLEEHRDAFWLSWLSSDPVEDGGAGTLEEGGDGTGAGAGAVPPDPTSAGTDDDPQQESRGTAPEGSSPPAGGAPAGTRGPAAATEESATQRPSAIRTFAGEVWNQVGSREGVQQAGTDAVRHWFGSLMGLLSMLVLLPIYTWYLLFELERLHAGVRRYVPLPERERVGRIARQIGAVLSSFFRGRLVVCALKGAFLSLGLFVLGVPYALFLGMVSGFASLIPFVGAALGYGFSFLVALLAPDASLLWTLVKVSVVFGLAEVLEGYVLIPKILGDTLGLHPLFVFVAIFIGGATMGMFGFLLALPLAAAGLILVRELVVPALEAFAREDPFDLRPDPTEGLATASAGDPSAPAGSAPGTVPEDAPAEPAAGGALRADPDPSSGGEPSAADGPRDPQ